MREQPPWLSIRAEGRTFYAEAIPDSLVPFDGRIVTPRFFRGHFLLHRLPSRLRPLALLIPPIMKRLVRPLFFHIIQLDTPSQT